MGQNKNVIIQKKRCVSIYQLPEEDILYYLHNGDQRKFGMSEEIKLIEFFHTKSGKIVGCPI